MCTKKTGQVGSFLVGFKPILLFRSGRWSAGSTVACDDVLQVSTLSKQLVLPTLDNTKVVIAPVVLRHSNH